MSPISLSALKPEYQKLWDTCTINPESKKEAEGIVARILAQKSRYQSIASSIGCPWEFVAVIHNMEASLNFNCHLHNGDPLSGYTYNEPPNRPAHGKPPFTWEESAEDALKLMQIDQVKDWSVTGRLFQGEQYNGWGYRLYHPEVLTPYLWSGTSHYVRGKYASDGYFDRNLKSEQIGIVPLLKLLSSNANTQQQPIAKMTTELLKGGACKLRIEKDAYLTQAPIPALELKTSDRILRVRAGTILPVLAWRQVGAGFLVVTFGKTLRGYNTWHVREEDVRMSPLVPKLPVQIAAKPVVPGDLSSLPGDKIIRFLHSRDFRVRALNIVYLVGASAEDWSPIPNLVDGWNDVRCVVRDNGEVLGSWQATTDPGEHYLENPMNPLGCAIVALGQHKDAWEIGEHKAGHWGLVQCGDLVIYRDQLATGVRSGHTVRAGAECGLNHHGTGERDGDPNSIGFWSAGCCVGLYRKSHDKFMDLCRHSGNSTFDATLIDGATLYNFR
jgi:lysozyme family protein